MRVCTAGFLALGSVTVACSGNEPDRPMGVDGPLATLTAAAAEGAPDEAAREAAMPTPGLPQELIGLPGTEPDVLPLDEPRAAGEVIEDVRATQRAEEAAAGIADVSHLVDAQPALATFTPAPGSAPDGNLLYVRSGRFYTVKADGSGNESLMADQLPTVWAPPDDPGRAWVAPDGRRVAFFAGRDAELWVMDVDGRNARALSGPNLPTGAHTLTFGRDAAEFRLKAGQTYTLVLTPGGRNAAELIIDDNSRHVRGEGRVRVVHAAEAAKGATLTVLLNGMSLRKNIRYGESTGDFTIDAGPLNIDVRDQNDNRVALLTGLTLDERELKTVFLYGAGDVRGVEATYESEPAASGVSRVRTFNSSSAAVDVAAGERVLLASALPAGALSTYADVPAPISNDELQSLMRDMYGLATGNNPIAWSPDSTKIAFVGGGDGQQDLYVADAGRGTTARVSRDAAREVNPAWSPDSRSVAYLSIDPSFDEHRLYVVRLGSQEPLEVPLDPVAAGVGRSGKVRIPLPLGWVDNERPFFYPVVQGSAGIWVVDGGQPRGIYTEVIDDAEWSPQAGAWAVVRAEAREIVVVRPDGTTSVVAPAPANAPLWSPDGRRIAWVRGEPTSADGWALHIMDADGQGDRALTERLPLLQESPPVPGPEAKRFWLDGGRLLGFTVAGRDYGAKDRSGGFTGEAGNDIENLWVVPVDGSAAPRRATDLSKVFYMKELTPRSDGSALGLIGFSYMDRTQKLWTVRTRGGNPVQIDGGVRWFTWMP